MAKPRYMEIQEEFDAFKQRVIETAWNWEAGCNEGKAEFLEALDLEVPKHPHMKATIEIIFQDEDFHGSLREAKDWFNESLDYIRQALIRNSLNGIEEVNLTSLEEVDYE